MANLSYLIALPQKLKFLEERRYSMKEALKLLGWDHSSRLKRWLDELEVMGEDVYGPGFDKKDHYPTHVHIQTVWQAVELLEVWKKKRPDLRPKDNPSSRDAITSLYAHDSPYWGRAGGDEEIEEDDGPTISHLQDQLIELRRAVEEWGDKIGTLSSKIDGYESSHAKEAKAMISSNTALSNRHSEAAKKLEKFVADLTGSNIISDLKTHNARMADVILEHDSTVRILPLYFAIGGLLLVFIHEGIENQISPLKLIGVFVFEPLRQPAWLLPLLGFAVGIALTTGLKRLNWRFQLFRNLKLPSPIGIIKRIFRRP